MKETLDALQLYKRLMDSGILASTGTITFNLADVSVIINTTDTVGVTLQSWLKQWLTVNNIYFSEPTNTQEFPDFYLSNTDKNNNLLEVKAFNFNAQPAFDIANFESYCSSIREKAYRLDADYLIFGYSMNPKGIISIKKMWLKKIWEIAGSSQRYPLKTQVKRDMIYNIRPCTNFKVGTPPPFKNKEEFINAIYGTLLIYKGDTFASGWLKKVYQNYEAHTTKKLDI